MISVEHKNNSFFITMDGMQYTFPEGAICTHAEGNSVEIRLKASRKNILAFKYTELTPSQPSADEAAKYIIK